MHSFRIVYNGRAVTNSDIVAVRKRMVMKNKLRVYENRILRRIFGPKRDENLTEHRTFSL